MRDLCPLISPDPGRLGPCWLLHCIEPGNRNFNTAVLILCPSPIYCVYTAAHERALWTQQKNNDVCYLLRCSVPLESTWLIERCVCGPATEVPMFLHQRCVYRAWSYRVHSDLATAILLSSGLRQPYHAMLAGIVGSMTGEP